MKKRNKFLALIFMLAMTILLVSCGAKEPELVGFYIDGYNEELTFVEDINEENIKLDLNFWLVYDNGTIQSFKTVDGRIALEEDQTDSKAIRLTVEGQPVVDPAGTSRLLNIKYTDNTNKIINVDFVQYLNNGDATQLGLAINYDERTLTHHQGYSFDASGSEVYLISSNGSASLVEHDQLTFEGGNYHPRGSEDGKAFLNNVSMPVTLKYDQNPAFEGINFDVRVSGGEAPIHSKTASFWNWIFLQMPIAFIASLFGSLFGNSLAWAIVMTTIVVRTVAWPIYAKTNDMSMKMAIAQPDMQKVQNKYATKKDPESQQKMQMELMAVYKKHNINMLGCLLPILQMPIFLAMFQVVRRIAIPGGQFYESVTKTSLLGIDLSSTETTIFNFIFAALVGVTMFVLQKLSAKKPSYAKKTGTQTADPKQQQSEQTMKMVSYFMIIMMVFASFATVSLAFYWIIGNIYSIGQTLINRHLNEVKYKKMQDEKLYGKGYKANTVIDAQFKDKGEK